MYRMTTVDLLSTTSLTLLHIMLQHMLHFCFCFQILHVFGCLQAVLQPTMCADTRRPHWLGGAKAVVMNSGMHSMGNASPWQTGIIGMHGGQLQCQVLDDHDEPLDNSQQGW